MYKLNAFQISRACAKQDFRLAAITFTRQAHKAAAGHRVKGSDYDPDLKRKTAGDTIDAGRAPIPRSSASKSYDKSTGRLGKLSGRDMHDPANALPRAEYQHDHIVTQNVPFDQISQRLHHKDKKDRKNPLILDEIQHATDSELDHKNGMMKNTWRKLKSAMRPPVSVLGEAAAQSIAEHRNEVADRNATNEDALKNKK